MKNKHRQLSFIFTLLVIALFINLPLVSALQISNVQVQEITDNSAEIIWETDEPADSFLNYGLSNTSLQRLGDAKQVTEHSFPLSNLQSETNYVFSVESNNLVNDNGGNLHTFTTLAPDTKAPLLEVELPEFVKGNKIDISGTAEAGATIKILVENIVRGTAIADSEGKFTISNVELQADTINSIVVEAKDASGNAATFSGTTKSDVSGPKLTLEELPELIEKAEVQIKGTLSEASDVEIIVNNKSGKKLESVVVIDVSVRLNEGKNSIKVIATDAVGWETSRSLSVESDTKAPTLKFDLTKGTEYYEGRAETDIVGETEPGAKLYLYIFERRESERKLDFDRAIATTTANEEGKFKFSEVSFPPPFYSRLDRLSPREVPAGLQEISTARVDKSSTDKRHTYEIYILAEDKSGKVAHAPMKRVNVNTCFSGEGDFDIFVNPNFPLQPFRLDPGLMEDGRERIGAVFNVSYRGDAVERVNPETGQPEAGYKLIGKPRFAKACTRQTVEQEDYQMGCKLLPSSMTAQGNADDTAFYVTANLGRAADFIERDEDIWDDFVDNRQLKFPLRIEVKYQEQGVDGTWETKTEVACQDLGYFVDIPIESQEMVPDVLIDYGVPALNATINGIEWAKEKLETAIIVTGVGCVGSFLTKLGIKLYRFFIAGFEPWTTRAMGDDEKCPVVQKSLYLDSTIDHWIGLREAGYFISNVPEDLNKDEHSLNTKCPQTAKAWETEAFFDKLYKGVCDRFLCRAVPARWTETKKEQEVKDVLNEQLQCADTSQCVPLRVIENCQERLKRNIVDASLIKTIEEDIFECYEDAGGVLYYRKNDRNQDESLLAAGIARLTPTDDILSLGSGIRDELLAYKPEGSDSYCVGVDKTCNTMCRRKSGYKAAEDGFSPVSKRIDVGRGSGWREGEDKVFNHTVFEATGRKDVWQSKRDGKFYNSDGVQVNAAGTKGFKEDGTDFVLEDIKEKDLKDLIRIEGATADWREATKPTTIIGSGCYQESKEGGKVELTGQNGAKIDEDKIRAGYTRDCFIDHNNPEDGLFQCVCEKTQEVSGRTTGGRIATDPQEGKPAEQWVYRQNRLFKESGGVAGTNYPEWRYYDGRDFWGAFGLDAGIDNFFDDKSQTKVDPHTQYLGSLQSACLTTINANLNMLQSTLIGLQQCLYEAKYTGEFDAGFCKTLFTQYVCGLIYKGIAYLGSECSPLSLKDVGKGYDPSDGGVSAFFSAGSKAIPGAIDSSINEVSEDYGNAKFNEFFRQGAQGFAESMCLVAFGYDFPMGLDFVHDAAYAASTKISVMFPIAERELTNFDPVKGNTIHNYNVGGFMFPGCKIRGYSTELKCITIDDLGNPGVDDTCQGRGCDCLQTVGSNPEFSNQRTHKVQGGSTFGNVQKGQFFDIPIDSPQKVTSPYRYDHVVYKVFLDPSESPEQCFDEGYAQGKTGVFYFPITETSAPAVAGCSVHGESGRFLCPELTSFFGGGQTYFEHPFMECYNRNTDEFVDCKNTPNLFLENEAIVVKPHMFLAGDSACLKITDDKGTVLQNFPLPEGQPGPYSRRISLATVTDEMLSGSGGISAIIKDQGQSDSGCGAHGATGGTVGSVEVIDRPSPDKKITARELRFVYERVGDKYRLIIPTGVTVEGGFGYGTFVEDGTGKRYLSPTSGTKDSTALTADQVNQARFITSDGFKITKVLGNPTLKSGASSGVCVYQVHGARGQRTAGNLGALQIKAQLLKPSVSGECYGATTLFPRSNLGSPVHDQTIRIQSKAVEVAAAQGIFNDFEKRNFEIVRGKAQTIINKRESTLDNAVAIYYFAASLIAEGKSVATFAGQLNTLLLLFFERDHYGERLLPYGLEENHDYEKIRKYMCEIDNKVNGASAKYYTNREYCVLGATHGVADSAAAANTECKKTKGSTHSCQNTVTRTGATTDCIRNLCENSLLTREGVTKPNDYMCCPK